jgi:hypothetical protein
MRLRILLIAIFLFALFSASLASNAVLDTAQQDGLVWVEGDGPVAAFDRDANVREGPATGFALIGGIRAGTRSEILAINPARDWFKVRYWNRSGWVLGSLVTVFGNTNNLEVDPGPPPPPPTATPLPTATRAPRQGPNLLIDGGFEGTYTNRGWSDFNIPEGWDIWYATGPHDTDWMNLRPVAFPHGRRPQIQSGRYSLNLNRGWATFTVAVYQQVFADEGAYMRGSAYAWLHICGEPSDPDPDDCTSDPSSVSGVRVGIDPNGGNDPYAPEIVWSGWGNPHDHWGLMVAETRVQGPIVTIFLFNHSEQPRAINNLYWDSAYLGVVR